MDSSDIALPAAPFEEAREHHAARLHGLSWFSAPGLTNPMPAVLPSPSERQAVRTAGLTTAVYDGFEVLHTRSTADTMRLFAQLTAAIQARIPAVRMPPLWTGCCFVLGLDHFNPR